MPESTRTQIQAAKMSFVRMASPSEIEWGVQLHLTRMPQTRSVSVCLGLSQIRIDAHSVTYNSAYYLIIISEIIIIRKVI